MALLKDRVLRIQALTAERNGLGIPVFVAPPWPPDMEADEAIAWMDKQIAKGLELVQAARAGEEAGVAIAGGGQLQLLEHLVDPGVVLDGLSARAAPGARLQVSVPNARHVQLVYDLVARGTFGYTEWGHRDQTHLRWFTRADIVALVQAHGWNVTGTGHPPLGHTARLNRATRGRASEFFANQWYVSAVRA